MIRRSFEAGCSTGFRYLPGSGDLRLHPGSQDRCVVCQGRSRFCNSQMENQKKPGDVNTKGQGIAVPEIQRIGRKSWMWLIVETLDTTTKAHFLWHSCHLEKRKVSSATIDFKVRSPKRDWKSPTQGQEKSPRNKNGGQLMGLTNSNKTANASILHHLSLVVDYIHYRVFGV